jgi:lantibiotic modifying enzyme
MEYLASASRRNVLHNREAASAWRRQLMARVTGGDWIADELHGLEGPGLMLGLAGTGYALLHAAHPQRIPSVLSFELL